MGNFAISLKHLVLVKKQMPTYGHFIPYGHFPIRYILYGHFIPYGHFPLWTLFHMDILPYGQFADSPSQGLRTNGSEPCTPLF